LSCFGSLSHASNQQDQRQPHALAHKENPHPKVALPQIRSCDKVTSTVEEKMPKKNKPGKIKGAVAVALGTERVKLLIPHNKIQKRIREMAKAIRADFPTEPLLLLGVLKGAVLFLADLARQIPGEVTFDFIAVSSYGKDSRSSGQVKLNKDIDSSIEGKTVIVVEDILDTGLTLRYLLSILQQRRPKNLRVAVLLDKVERRLTDVHADYVGFPIPNEFVVGYGLDYAERYRNLPDVKILSLPGATH
jgi:hypoxanthine phosphoribosyltransferase